MSKKTRRRSPKRPRQKRKRQYRIRNWHKYNQALVQRGSLTLWVDEAALQGWCAPAKSGQRGASKTYSDSAIVCALTLQAVYHLPLRATQGLLGSLLAVLRVVLPVPHYSTLCRRRQHLRVPLPRPLARAGLHLVVDATGFKVFGEGEWKVKMHGWIKHRVWRKLHIGIDAATGEIQAAVATASRSHEKELLPTLLEQVAVPVGQVSGDGAYDYISCYMLLAQRGARATISPRRNACIWGQVSGRAQVGNRDANLRRIQELQGRKRKDPNWGRKQWKRESGYHRRSLVETGIFRLKTIFGDKLSARQEPGQDNELLLRCAALNKMTALAMPESYAVA